MDEQGDATQAVTLLHPRCAITGINALVGDVTTTPIWHLLRERRLHMPMVTASATAEDVNLRWPRPTP